MVLERVEQRPTHPAAAGERRHEQLVHDSGARLAGTEHQVDTYFNVSHGRLKLREGNIENNLIAYHRPDQDGPKRSDFKLVRVPEPAALKEALTLTCGVKIVITKKREIWYIDNVKFHLDEVPELGMFVEIEAFNEDGLISAEQLEEQCRYYMVKFGVQDADLIENSYSDLVLARIDQRP